MPASVMHIDTDVPPTRESAALRLDHARHALRGVLRRPAIGREREWVAAVSKQLNRSLFWLQEYRGEVRGPHCDYEKICLESQWMVPRLLKLSAEFEACEAQGSAVDAHLRRASLGEPGSVFDARTLALRFLARLHVALREENAIVFDRFIEPPALD